MATLYGVNATKTDVTTPSVKVDANEDGGRMRVKYDTYVAAGAIALNDVIKMGKLPKGAKVYDVRITSTDLGTTGTLDVGWSAGDNGDEAADPDGFIDAHIATTTGGDLTSMAGTIARTDAPGYLKTFADSVDIEILAQVATTAAGTIELTVTYSLD